MRSLEGSSRFQEKTWGGEERNAPSSASSCLLWGTSVGHAPWEAPAGVEVVWSWGGGGGGTCSRERIVQTY